MITKVTTKGVGAEDQDVAIGEHSLIVAPSGYGKSKLLDAIRCAFNGYIPALGKRPADTALLLRDRAMEVDITVADHGIIHRELRRVGETLTRRVKCSWIKESAGQEAHHVAAYTLVGEDELQAAEATDVRALINATPTSRQARLEQMMAASTLSPKERIELVCEFVARRLTDKENDTLDDWRALIPTIPGTMKDGNHVGQRQALASAWGALEAQVLSGGVGGCLGWAKELKNLHSARALNKKRARKELETRIEGIAEPDESSIAALEEERSAVEQEIGAISARNIQVRETNDKIAEAAEKLDRARTTLADAQSRKAQVSEVDEKRSAAEKRLTEIAGALEQLNATPPVRPDMADLDAIDEEVRQLRAQIGGIELPRLPELRSLEHAVTRIQNAIDAAKRLPWMEVDQRARTIARETVGCDPEDNGGMIGNIRSECDSLIALAAANGLPNTDELQQQLATAQADLEAAKATADNVIAERDRLEKQIAELREQASKLETEAKGKRLTRNEAFNAAADDHRAKVSALNSERDTLRNALSHYRSRNENADGDVSLAESEVIAAESALSALGAAALPFDDTAERSRLTTINADIRELQQLRARFAELRQTVSELAAEEALYTVYEAIEWACLRAREKELAQGSGGLEKFVNQFLTAAGRKERWFFDAADDCKIGWKHPDMPNAVSCKVMSGGQLSLFLCAFTAAVILIRNPPVKILLTEAGETDRETLQQLLAGISAMDGLQGLVAVQREEPVPAGWSVISPATSERKAA